METKLNIIYERYQKSLEDYEPLPDNNFKLLKLNDLVKFIETKYCYGMVQGRVSLIDEHNIYIRVYDFYNKKYHDIGRKKHMIFRKKKINPRQEFNTFLENIINNLPQKNTSAIEN